MLGMAVRYDAIAVNPDQQTSRIHREKSETRSLTLEDLNTVREALRAWTAKQRPGPKASSDMSDIIDLMLATGGRIGEILAVRWADVELGGTRPNLTISGTIKTESGKGTYRKSSPKSDASVRTVVLPDFAVAVLRRRQGAAKENPNDAVFPTRNGTWQQVNNVERRWRQIRKDTGLDWVTPHTFRKTVATLISERVDAETAPSNSATPPPQSPGSSTSPSRRSRPTSRTCSKNWLAVRTIEGAAREYLGNKWGMNRVIGFKNRTASDLRFRRSEAVFRSG